MQCLQKDTASFSIQYGHYLNPKVSTSSSDTLLYYMAYSGSEDMYEVMKINTTQNSQSTISEVIKTPYSKGDPTELILAQDLIIVFHKREKLYVAHDRDTGEERWRRNVYSIYSVDDDFIHAGSPNYSRIRIQDGALFSTDQYWSVYQSELAASPAYHFGSSSTNFEIMTLFRNTTGCPAMRIHHPGVPDGEKPDSRTWSQFSVLDQAAGKIYMTDGFDLFIYDLP